MTARRVTSAPRPWWEPLLTIACGLLLVLNVVGLVQAGASVTASSPTDFRLFYYATKAWQDGGSFYGVTSASRWETLTGIPLLDLAPPHFHVLVLPLTKLPFVAAYRFWVILNILALIASVWLITKELAIRWTPLTLLSFALAVITSTASTVLLLGQYGWLLLLPCTLAWTDLRNDRWTRGYAWLGIIATIKPFAALMAIYALWRGRPRAAGAMIAAGAACLALGTGLFGLTSYVAWLAALSLTSRNLAWMLDNMSITGMLARGLTPSTLFTPIAVAPEWVWPLSAVAATAILLVSCWQVRDLTIDRAWIVLWLAGFLVSPIAWVHYAWWVLGPLMAIARSQRWLTRPFLYLAVFAASTPARAVLSMWKGPGATISVASTLMWVTLVTWALALRSPSTLAGADVLTDDLDDRFPAPTAGHGSTRQSRPSAKIWSRGRNAGD